MLLLNKSSINKMYIICNDLLTIDNPVYLWRFVHSQTLEQYLIELVNESEVSRSYDLFSLNLPVDLELSEGQYLYEVYQSEEEGDDDFSNMPLLANGVARVTSIFETTDSYEPTAEQDSTYTG